MKIIRNRAVCFVLTAALLLGTLMSSGCNMLKSKDFKEIEDLTRQFVDAYGRGDEYETVKLVNGKFVYKNSGNKALAAVASKTNIVNVNNVIVEDNKRKANAEIVFSFVNFDELASMFSEKYHSSSEMISVIDSFDKFHEEKIMMRYVYDDDNDQWLIDDDSAEAYEDIYSESAIMTITTIMSVYESFAAGDFNSGYYAGYYFDCFTLSSALYSGDVDACEAIYKFATAYDKYILEHGLRFTQTDDPHKVTVNGLAPSREAVLGYFDSEEYVVDAYKIFYKAKTSDYDYDDMWYQKDLETHLRLAEKIPEMDGDYFEITLTIDPDVEDHRQEIVYDIFPISRQDAYNTIMAYDEHPEIAKIAVEELYMDNEITKVQYDAFMVAVNRDCDPHRDQRYEFIIVKEDAYWAGTDTHKNQADRVAEYLPDYSDGDIIYGYEYYSTDDLTLEYSKQPGWLNTAGYCKDGGNITVMVLFDREFAQGTVLEYDWYSGKDPVDFGTITVDKDGTAEFEFTLNSAKASGDGALIFRLWEEGHNHVIAYVELTKS